MNIELSDQAKEDIAHWNRVDPSRTAKIQRLLQSVMQTPYSGLGKPEPLKDSYLPPRSAHGRIESGHRTLPRAARGIECLQFVRQFDDAPCPRCPGHDAFKLYQLAEPKRRIIQALHFHAFAGKNGVAQKTCRLV